ncbi:hypothetical protein VE04_05063 [Pseudogymnoascus sp. 24MN13]|nr:hypothetical protein VE04_05063 [Pseudogymnoascus sp. 24MN13]
MNKLANMRHWSEKMGPGFGMSRPNPNMPPNMPPCAAPPAQHHKGSHNGGPSPIPQTAADAFIHYSFNVPFASDLEGPIIEDIVHATPDRLREVDTSGVGAGWGAGA